MKALAAVCWEELSRRRQLLMAAAAAALLPLVLPYVMRLNHPAAEVREVLAWVIALLLGGLFALFLGVSFIGSDLAGGRLGFAFAQPVRATTLWFGKLIAVYLLSTASMFLILLPAALLDWSSFTEDSDILVPLALLLTAPLIIILVCHAVSIMARARSAWLLLDVAALVTTGIFCWWAWRPIFAAGALIALGRGIAVFGVMAVLALILAGACQVARGRTDLRRAHQALSIPLWIVVLIGAAGQLGYSHWLRSAEPDDLVLFDTVLAEPDGDWFAVSGRARGRADFTTTLLIKPDGPWLRLDQASPWWSQNWLEFSANGDAAVLLQGPPLGGTRRNVVTIDLGEAQPQLSSTGLTLDAYDWWSDLAYDGDKKRIALLNDGLLSVHDLDQDRLLFSTRIPAEAAQLLWLGPERLRAYVRKPAEDEEAPRALSIIEVDLRTRGHRETGRIVLPPGSFPTCISLDRRAERMLVDERWRLDTGRYGRRVGLYDAITGEPDPAFDATALEHAESACFLADDRIVAEVSTAGRSVLRVLAPSGEPTRDIDPGEGDGFLIGSQPSSNTLLVVIYNEETAAQWGGWRTVEIDLESGTIHPVGTGLRPVLTRARWFFHKAVQPETPGSLSTRLFTKGRNQLLLRDENTGELRRILGRG